MLAWEWNMDKAREEEESEKKKAASRKISQTAQVQSSQMNVPNTVITTVLFIVQYIMILFQATYDPSHGYSPQPIDISHMALSRDLQVWQ